MTFREVRAITRTSQANYRQIVLHERHRRAMEDELDVQDEYKRAATAAVEDLRNNWRNV